MSIKEEDLTKLHKPDRNKQTKRDLTRDPVYLQFNHLQLSSFPQEKSSTSGSMASGRGGLLCQMHSIVSAGISTLSDKKKIKKIKENV